MASANFSIGTSGLVSPSAIKQVTTGSYLDLASTAGQGWAQQYLPELYEAEIERYGDRTIGSFLRMVGAEMPMQADQVVWSEQGRLHIAYKATVNTGTGVITAGSFKDIDNQSGSSIDHILREGQNVLAQVTTGSDVVVLPCQVVGAPSSNAAANGTATLKPYEYENLDDHASIATASTAVIKLFVTGSDFGKGSDGMTDAVQPEFKSFNNKPIIIKDKYEVSGSDVSQIGWVEISGEDGQNGYLWYLKAAGDTKKRFEDYLEMSVIEGVSKSTSGSVSGATGTGTEGLFQAIEDRGLVSDAGMFDGASDDLADFDILLKELDKQGAIEENMLFLDRSANLAFDNMLAGANNYHSAGTNYGVFNNSEDMALNLGFNGFRRGSYDFYKTDWKYLNSKSSRGLVNEGATVGKVEGVLVPAGTSTVYDQGLGKNINRPFLHVRYRASEADDRKMKSWITGSVGAATSAIDKMEVHYLSERCLVVQAANNFCIFR